MDSPLNAIAATLVQLRLLDAHLPPPEGDVAVTSHMDDASRAVTDRVLRDLERLYRVREWTPQTFRSVVLERVLPAWRRDIEVYSSDRHLMVRSMSCPLLATAQRDPARCRLCQAVHARLVQQGTGGRIDAVSFESVVTDEAGECALVGRASE